MGSIAKALAGAFQSFGGEIMTDAGVDKILVKNGETRGVVLENGDEHYADIVVSNLDPKRTFLKIMDENDLPPDVVKKAKNFKIRGSSGKLNISLDGMPSFYAVEKGHELLRADFHFIDSMERMERAYERWQQADAFLRQAAWAKEKPGSARAPPGWGIYAELGSTQE